MSANGTILVTGGAGYIGSHTVLELLNEGFSIVVLDNLHNAYMEKEALLPESLNRIVRITGKNIKFYKADVRNKEDLRAIFQNNKIDAVGHFAALKAVAESCEKPLDYYETNVMGTIALLQVMKEYGVKNFVYSSSATVYGQPEHLPLTEKHPTGRCVNPYGKTKFFSEEILKDACKNNNYNVISLRYFNPVGAHASGLIGEDPKDIPNNLMPYICQVAVGIREYLNVYGNDYDTVDGTGIRDYIHIVDLAQGHVKAFEKLIRTEIKGFVAYNLGTGLGYSVLDVVKAFCEASNIKLPYKIGPRRDGDLACYYSDPSLAAKELNWKAKLGLKQMCQDVWKWQSNNPNGYTGKK
uniref:UDP-glucose 4-epimerase n=1 Tax=Culicoides sonorensis TaxID=179676 RepID=A0A336KTB9_CULSO